ncbi:hypothetical protein CKM354_000266600 [Cercospora kikuchii]|uniref:Uncharacterized protein n=1 Tax=Cercospora kikuchii TaxID=84275 RepID=A0A9P3CDB9_9PEZI|nr:uncharacterized protein CKM354_000266600 [Cercospora kikuchii]GIZ39277.1 hypothetical protein CKM354_000266600 [Cercospora kikuchii]
MSSDLFAAFGEPPAAPSTPAPAADDDDDFGDFEDASAAVVTDMTQAPGMGSTTTHVTPAAPKALPFSPKTDAGRPEPDQVIGRHPFADHMDFLFSGGDDEYDAGADDLEDLSRNPEAAMAYSKRMIAEQEAQAKKKPLPFSKPQSPAKNPPKAPNKLQKKSGYVPTRDLNVLFDADNVSEHDTDDDDFGDFEAAPSTSRPNNTSSTPAAKPAHGKLQKKNGPPGPKTPKVTAAPRMPQIDLLGLGDEVSVPEILSPRSERANNILGHAKADSMTRPKGSSLVPKREDDAWDDFDATEPVTAPALVPAHSGTRPNPSPNSTILTSTSVKSTDQNGVPPTNVPPPIILLSAFTSIFSSAQEALFAPLSKLDLSSRAQLLAHPATHQFLTSYLKSAIVLAHIIAGRKFRWKRDQILAQSMRIGPSAAGGKGGMKLTSIDKSEVGKEDREVLDVVQKWKGQVGKLRTAVTTASGTPQTGKDKLPSVPEIAETMPVKTLKATEGGFVAPHACALCGLKREERVAKVDSDVNDSFGEWWVDNMSMHVTCRDWWHEYRNKLKGR